MATNRRPRLCCSVRLHSQSIRIAEPARDEADLYSLHMRNRYNADSIRHGRRQRHYHSRESENVRLNIGRLVTLLTVTQCVHVEGSGRVRPRGRCGFYLKLTICGRVIHVRSKLWPVVWEVSGARDEDARGTVVPTKQPSLFTLTASCFAGSHLVFSLALISAVEYPHTIDVGGGGSARRYYRFSLRMPLYSLLYFPPPCWCLHARYAVIFG